MGIPQERTDDVRARREPRHLHAVGDGGPLTLSWVYREHVDFVVRTTRHLGVPEPQVEDVVHDVFLVVHRRLDDYDERAPLRSWLYGITRRVVLHHKRRTSRARAREARAPAPSPAPSLDEGIARDEAAVLVEACLASLDIDQRMVFVLADIEGLTAPQIAEATGVKLNTVYSRLRLGRRKFERALAQRLEGKAPPAKGAAGR
ncbi:MAG: sigma-70 family RNA polymerase sigma factor [Myxococcota bacterium]